MLLPFVGITLADAYLAVISNFKLHPLFFLIFSCLGSITGGWVILLMAMFSFLGDYSTEKVGHLERSPVFVPSNQVVMFSDTSDEHCTY